MGMLTGKTAPVTGAGVNGQVFHSFGYGCTLLAQPQAVRSIRAERRWDPEELARVFPSNWEEP